MKFCLIAIVFAALALSFGFSTSHAADIECSLLNPCPGGMECEYLAATGNPLIGICRHDPPRTGEVCTLLNNCGDGDDYCKGFQQGLAGRCTRYSGIGEECDLILTLCDDELRCRPEPRKILDPAIDSNVANLRCYPEILAGGHNILNNLDLCRDWYDPDVHKATNWDDLDVEIFDPVTVAYQEGRVISFGRTVAVSVAAGFIIDVGGVYDKNGNYGCYETECLGGTTNFQGSTAVTTGEYFRLEGDDAFEGESIATIAEAGYVLSGSVADIRSIDGSTIGQSFGLAVGGSELPVDIGEFYCDTNYVQVARNFELITSKPPIADAGADQVLECESPTGVMATLDGSGSSDPDGGAIVEYIWAYSFGTADGPTPTVPFPLGMETASLIVVDDEGDSSQPDTVQVTVEDTVPPEGSIRADPAVLWPPNNKMVPVHIEADVMDTCDAAPECLITDVTSSEGRMRRRDWQIDGDLSLQLRAKRKGNGPGGTYTIDVECADASGNVSTATTEVLVPHDQSQKD